MEFEKPLSKEDLPKIEKEMAKIVKSNFPFIKKIKRNRDANHKIINFNRFN